MAHITHLTTDEHTFNCFRCYLATFFYWTRCPHEYFLIHKYIFAQLCLVKCCPHSLLHICGLHGVLVSFCLWICVQYDPLLICKMWMCTFLYVCNPLTTIHIACTAILKYFAPVLCKILPTRILHNQSTNTSF